MNKITIGCPSAVAEAHKPNQRAQAKRRTREKIVGAARSLFAERGYDASTIRDIAKAAGMSTGAVFASFTDKADLFTEIAEAEQAELHQAMQLAGAGLSGRAAIAAMLDAASERQADELALVRAVMSALWTPGLAERARRRLERRPVSSLIAAAVRQEFADDATVDSVFIAEMIWDGYMATLRRGALGGLTPSAMKARVDAVTRTILAGAQPG